MAKIAPFGRSRYGDANNAPLNGGKLYTYDAGTTTPKATYTDNTGVTPNPNPIILDANGYADVWLGTGGYKFVLKDTSDVLLWTKDNIDGGAATGFASSVITKSSSFNLSITEQNNVVVCTSALTVSLLPVATAGQGFSAMVVNVSAGTVTIAPNGSETINGASTLVLASGESVTIHTDGLTWYAGRGDVANASVTPAKLAFGITRVVSPYAGSTAPTGWLMCFGQAVSRVTYSALFAIVGTTYGVGDGSTTFNLPDLRGRSIFGLDNMGGSAASRLTSGVSGITSTTLGAVGGDERMQSHNHTVTDPGHIHSIPRSNVGYNGGGAPGPVNGDTQLSTNTNSATTGITIASAGAGSSQNVPPAMVMNCIIKT